ncbi:hypothetical protein HK405_003037, partial [Cladochytrium tenue]
MEVETLCGENIQVMENAAEFLRRRAEVEADYAKNLARLCRSWRDDVNRRVAERRPQVAAIQKAVVGSTGFQAWMQLLNETELAASVHHALAEKLEQDIRQPIKKQAAVSAAKTKQRFDDIRGASADVQKQVACMEKMRERYELDKKSMEQAHEKVLKSAKGPEAAAEA